MLASSRRRFYRACRTQTILSPSAGEAGRSHMESPRRHGEEGFGARSAILRFSVLSVPPWSIFPISVSAAYTIALRGRGRAPRRRTGIPELPLPVRRCEVLGDEVPVHEVVEEGLDEVRPPVLVVEIIGVLPDVDGEERGLPLRQRIHGVGRLRHLERAAIEHEPGPAAAELGVRRFLELVAELVDVAEGLLDAEQQVAARAAAAPGAHAVPEEAVVPGLRRIVEDRRLRLVPGGGADHVLERLAGERRVLHQLVERRHIGLVMLAVVKLQGARRHIGLKAVLRIRQGREFEGHGILAEMTGPKRLSEKGTGPCGPGSPVIRGSVRTRRASPRPSRKAWGSRASY